mgnify:CR=1 FL=1
MKLCKVTSETVVIPVMPEITWHDMSFISPDTVIDIQKRYVHLHYREYDGRMIISAYDRETDTLFVKDE